MAKATKKAATKKTAPKKVQKAEVDLSKKALVAAAKDINKADIADPEIDVKGSEDELKAALVLAAQIIEDEDPLTKTTFAVLKALTECADCEPEEAEEETPEEEEKDEEETEPEVDDDDREADEPEEKVEEKPAKFKDKKPAKPVDGKKAETKAPEKKAGKKVVASQVTRKDAFVIVLKKIGKQGISISEFSEKVVKVLLDSGKNKVGRLEYESKFFLEVLTDLGYLASTTDGKFKSI